jgi:Flp pilus assembly CpaF family ATPase/pSer/pThr/pTyr-binding forkhead associated (FHA) protein
MKIWFNNVIDTERNVAEISGNRVRIGRNTDNDIVLDSPFIAGEAAVLHKRRGAWELVALGINGVKLGDRQLYNGDRCEIRTNQSISLFPFTVTLDLPYEAELDRSTQRKDLDENMSELIGHVHLELLQRMNLSADSAGQRDNEAYLLELERTIDTITRNKLFRKDKTALVTHTAGHGLRDHMLARSATSQAPDEIAAERHWSEIQTIVPDREDELQSTAEYIEGLLDISPGAPDKQKIDAIDIGFWASWESVGGRLHAEFRQYLALRYMKKEVKNIVFGYGPLEDLLRLPSVSEIMVVDREHVYIERNGVLENSGKRFISDEVIETIIQRIVARVSRRIDKSQPLVDARLSDGSRVNAVIAPLAVSGPTLTIRKFPYRKILIDDLVAFGALTRTVAEFLRAIVLSRRNILISGGTGTGKTTLLNCLSDFIPDQERIVTVEDTAELQLAKEHVVRMETKEANVEGTGEYTIRDLVRNALRMRPDRIVVGECRGPEALDMLQAMNTGHDGSLTTIHANTAADVLLRLEVLVQMAADLPVSSIHQQIGSAIDIIVQLKRMRDGRRIVSQISECTGVNPKTKKIELRDLYLLDSSPDSSLQPTGRLPTFIGDIIEAGMLNLDSFYHQQNSEVPS